MRFVKIAFDVEQAGCESCGARVRSALAPLGSVESVRIDEEADTARVVLAVPSAATDQAVVDAALAHASAGAGHLYRVRPGSWNQS
jgi:hypothetical protein